MTPDLEKSIIEKYPSLFANVGQKGSPMCFGLEVGDGWAGIISTMCFILNQKDTAKTFRFDQIKEKFGLLRVYHTGGNEYMAGVVRMACDISGRTCEVCGQPGEQRKGGWIKTLCDRCHGGESQVLSQENLMPDASRELLSRTGSNSRQTRDNATGCRSQGGNHPERGRLTDAERSALAELLERLYPAGSGYTSGISAGVDSKPTLTDEERAAVEYFAAFHRSPREADANAAATLRGLLERLGGER